MIYRGILHGSRNAAVICFAKAHLAAQRTYPALIEFLPRSEQCNKLLPLWRVRGWHTGLLPALSGSRAAHAAICAVEAIVVRDYEEPIVKPLCELQGGTIGTVLLDCQAGEARHRYDALALQAAAPGTLLAIWTWMVEFGSKIAVYAARRI